MQSLTFMIAIGMGNHDYRKLWMLITLNERRLLISIVVKPE